MTTSYSILSFFILLLLVSSCSLTPTRLQPLSGQANLSFPPQLLEREAPRFQLPPRTSVAKTQVLRIQLDTADETPNGTIDCLMMPQTPKLGSTLLELTEKIRESEKIDQFLVQRLETAVTPLTNTAYLQVELLAVRKSDQTLFHLKFLLGHPDTAFNILCEHHQVGLSQTFTKASSALIDQIVLLENLNYKDGDPLLMARQIHQAKMGTTTVGLSIGHTIKNGHELFEYDLSLLILPTPDNETVPFVTFESEKHYWSRAQQWIQNQEESFYENGKLVLRSHLNTNEAQQRYEIDLLRPQASDEEERERQVVIPLSSTPQEQWAIPYAITENILDYFQQTSRPSEPYRVGSFLADFNPQGSTEQIYTLSTNSKSKSDTLTLQLQVVGHEQRTKSGELQLDRQGNLRDATVNFTAQTQLHYTPLFTYRISPQMRSR